jgi:hypothetical protein
MPDALGEQVQSYVREHHAWPIRIRRIRKG